MRSTLTTRTTAALVALAAALLLAPTAGAQTCPAPTPEQLIFDKMSFIATLDIPSGIQNMLYVELTATLEELAQNDTEAAVAELEDFIAKVTTQRGRQLTVEDADVLLGLAQTVIDLLSTPDCPCLGEPQFVEALAAVENGALILDCVYHGARETTNLVNVFAFTPPLVTLLGSQNLEGSLTACFVQESGTGGAGTTIDITAEQHAVCAELVLATTEAATGTACTELPPLP